MMIIIINCLQVRTLLGIPPGTSNYKLVEKELKDFDVFIQSTSYNRILLPDTEFLYDTGEGSETTTVAAKATPEAKPSKSKIGRGGGKGKRKKEEEVVGLIFN